MIVLVIIILVCIFFILAWEKIWFTKKNRKYKGEEKRVKGGNFHCTYHFWKKGRGKNILFFWAIIHPCIILLRIDNFILIRIVGSQCDANPETYIHLIKLHCRHWIYLKWGSTSKKKLAFLEETSAKAWTPPAVDGTR